MIERVGECSCCGKPVYCRDGFLDGVIAGDGKLYCQDCREPAEKPAEKSRD